LSLVAFARGFAVAGAFTAAKTLDAMFGTGIGAECLEVHGGGEKVISYQLSVKRWWIVDRG
jgi:hypothetical protein